jgi:hypothetical protein
MKDIASGFAIASGAIIAILWTVGSGFGLVSCLGLVLCALGIAAFFALDVADKDGSER